MPDSTSSPKPSCPADPYYPDTEPWERGDFQPTGPQDPYFSFGCPTPGCIQPPGHRLSDCAPEYDVAHLHCQGTSWAERYFSVPRQFREPRYTVTTFARYLRERVASMIHIREQRPSHIDEWEYHWHFRVKPSPRRWMDRMQTWARAHLPTWLGGRDRDEYELPF